MIRQIAGCLIIAIAAYLIGRLHEVDIASRWARRKSERDTAEVPFSNADIDRVLRGLERIS